MEWHLVTLNCEWAFSPCCFPCMKWGRMPRQQLWSLTQLREGHGYPGSPPANPWGSGPSPGTLEAIYEWARQSRQWGAKPPAAWEKTVPQTMVRALSGLRRLARSCYVPAHWTQGRPWESRTVLLESGGGGEGQLRSRGPRLDGSVPVPPSWSCTLETGGQLSYTAFLGSREVIQVHSWENQWRLHPSARLEASNLGDEEGEHVLKTERN